ncbi:TonB-dependent receptor [Tenacibaculum sp. SG-28]|uniref:TonB-dependent receptor n=1 Tax=Tenacibaculum sp. SG-28 TaxID=754426 RepID=UPI000CF3915D|nr:TonB-dependent receptor [Tenacibaculum sp. SG-28]PQJ22958.1 hypothetical protein BSU00_01385 [Tenacibaculum sp. SG-28]
MKNYVWLFVLLLAVDVKAQEKTKRANDTIKTEVINVVTSYVPKITDAFKIKQKPMVSSNKETEKKKLSYTIRSIPVASTFVPKSGTLKKIDLGERERLYDNFLSLGFGNNIAPALQGYFRQSTSRDSELGIYANFNLSMDPVANTELNSTYYNMDIDMSHKKTERYFTWEAGINLERDGYNWYGLPSQITFNDNVIEAIEEGITYGFYKVYGAIDFDDSYISTANTSAYFLTDGLGSSEFNFDLDADFSLPLDLIHNDLNALSVSSSINFLGGSFATSYEDQKKFPYSFFTLGVQPSYAFIASDLYVKLGGKAYFSIDLENDINNFLLYPDVEISYPIIKDFAKIYIGAGGDLTTNNFKEFTDENPFVSPTLNITQTNEMYQFFGGVQGMLHKQFSYHFKGSFSSIEDNPFYTLNYSKTDGSKATGDNGFILNGFEFGNSFRVIYDDIKRTTIFGEISYEGFKNSTLGATFTYHSYTLNNLQHPWNAPTMKGELFGEYKMKKWYAGANVFFVGKRKGVAYATNAPSPFTAVDLDSYIDVNMHGGYNFSDDFSVYLNLKNMLNQEYQRFTNFNVQGFQVFGGVTWKFDSLF